MECLSKLAKYELGLGAVQEVRWGVMVSQEMSIHFFTEMGMLIITS